MLIHCTVCDPGGLKHVGKCKCKYSQLFASKRKYDNLVLFVNSL